MKKAIITLLVLSFSKFPQAQIASLEIREKIESVAKSTKEFCDSTGKKLEYVRNSNDIVTDGSYKKYIDRYFTYLAYNRGVLPSGNSASLEIANNSSQLELSLSKKVDQPKGRILLLTGGIKAKLDDGIAQLFSGSNTSSGTTFFGNFAFLPGSSSHKVASEVTKFVDGKKITTEFDKLKQKRQEYQNYFCQNATVNFRSKYNALLDCWIEINKKLKTATEGCDIAELTKKKEEIEKQLKDAGLLDLKAGKISGKMQKEYEEAMYDLETETDAWQWITFRWISGGITYNRESFDTYNESNSVAKRFGSRDFDAVGLRITAHWFREKLNVANPGASYYFNISYEPKTTNSYTIIKSQDILRNILRSVNPDTTYFFQSNKKAKNITGKKYNTGWEHHFSSTYTIMVGKKQNTGINLRGESIVCEFSSPVYNAHGGILLRMVNNDYDPADKKSKAKINFELFIELPDISDVGGSGKNAWQNKVIGIHTSIPFNKIFFK